MSDAPTTTEATTELAEGRNSVAENPPLRSRANALRQIGSMERARSLTLLGILIAVALLFQILTDGLFLTSRNLTVLSVQVAITAILAAGIVMIMVPAHIDLSIGAAVSVTAIVTALTMKDLGVSAPVAIVLTLLAGLAIGIWHGFWVAVMGVPAFIVTLASLLALRGLALLLTKGETVAPDVEITKIAATFIDRGVTVVIFALLLAGFTGLLLRERKARLAAGMAAPMGPTVLLPSVLFGLMCLGAALVAVSYQGLPLPVLFLLVVVVAISLLLRQTRFGRHLYAMGGNPVAARYAGIRTRRHTFTIFAIMGVLYGIAGLILVARLGSAPPNAATGLELNVIAAAVIGGTSLLGGVGTVAGAIMGALLMESLNNGMSLMNLPSYWQQIAVGFVLLIAVYLDVRSRREKT
jgi:ABC-type xylose transport system permease subunit